MPSSTFSFLTCSIWKNRKNSFYFPTTNPIKKVKLSGLKKKREIYIVILNLIEVFIQRVRSEIFIKGDSVLFNEWLKLKSHGSCSVDSKNISVRNLPH
jgi:hypothetical protein